MLYDIDKGNFLNKFRSIYGREYDENHLNSGSWTDRLILSYFELYGYVTDSEGIEYERSKRYRLLQGEDMGLPD